MTRSASGPLLIDICTFFAITPTTLYGSPSTSMSWPIGSSAANSFRAMPSPRKTTRRLPMMSASLRKRPGAGEEVAHEGEVGGRPLAVGRGALASRG